jgi:hypothetical protein
LSASSISKTLDEKGAKDQYVEESEKVFGSNDGPVKHEMDGDNSHRRDQ